MHCSSRRATPRPSPPPSRRVLDDGDLAARLHTAGWERAQRFSMTALAAEYVAIYRELIATVEVAEPGRLRRAWQRVSG